VIEEVIALGRHGHAVEAKHPAVCGRIEYLYRMPRAAAGLDDLAIAVYETDIRV
jgi:hypothetical protein